MMANALAIVLLVGTLAQAQQFRIYGSHQRAQALEEARSTCQPLVLLFYNSSRPEQDIINFFSTPSRMRDAALAKAVVVLLPMQDWKRDAEVLGVVGAEGMASVSPFELEQIAPGNNFGDNRFL